MKARIKATGETVDIITITDSPYGGKKIYAASDRRWYREHELDFSVNEAKDAEGEVISGWVARDMDGEIYLYGNKPKRGCGEWLGRISSKFDFQKITWHSEPIEVEITIKPKKR